MPISMEPNGPALRQDVGPAATDVVLAALAAVGADEALDASEGMGEEAASLLPSDAAEAMAWAKAADAALAEGSTPGGITSNWSACTCRLRR